MNGRRSKNFIGSLKNNRGDQDREEKEVEKEILSFCSGLYALDVVPKLFVEDLDWCPIRVSKLSWTPFFHWKKSGMQFLSVIGTSPLVLMVFLWLFSRIIRRALRMILSVISRSYSKGLSWAVF